MPIKKELDNGKTITYKIKFFDTFRFMSISLLRLVDKLSEISSEECREKIVNLSVILLGLKIINYFIDATNVKKDN